jgi:two-component system cell cycle sensor histidine kinase/response regulator CckA
LEAQLFQAQKMESVGRLAGGVAHDFNNMLGVIIGHTDLALDGIEPSDPLFLDLQEIRKAAQRSADLTRQLLAFARRQTVSPRVLDLNDTIAGMLNMLRRLIGEDIELAWLPGHDLWKVKVDPSQIDQVLANLTVNARDAIAGIGSITLRTENAVIDASQRSGDVESLPGAYVLLTVTDSGVGMDKKVLEHVFEPFFTTKEVGKGTGLGLATVYGIIKQNRGFVSVSSEPGQGATFKIYLPRFEGKCAEASIEDPGNHLPGGTETVLIVEDEKAILKLGKAILERLGYRVLSANTPGEAIRLAREYASDIHLLITDVVMPEMNGRELAQRLASLRPRMQCLFMSGYTADVIAHHSILDEGVNFIQKPFSMKPLAAKVREVLEGLAKG